MNQGITSQPMKDRLLDQLRERDAHHAPAPITNPPFIAEDDLGGDGHSRGTREVARFSAFSNNLVKTTAPFDPEQASVKVPRLMYEIHKGETPGEEIGSGWFITEYVVCGAVTLSPHRPSKFNGKPNLDCPSQKLAAFCKGEGEAWGWRDEDVHQLLLAWANAVEPSRQDARRASEALAVALAARCGIAVTTTASIPF